MKQFYPRNSFVSLFAPGQESRLFFNPEGSVRFRRKGSLFAPIAADGGLESFLDLFKVYGLYLAIGRHVSECLRLLVDNPDNKRI